MDDVGKWLSDRGFEHLHDLFAENEIDADVLPELTNDDLKELGLTLGARKKLLKAIATEFSESPAAVEVAAPEPAAPIRAAGVERRQLTIMFVDLVGSTELAQRFDPEEMRNVMTSYQNTVAGIVTRFDGHIAKYMGDGVLCYFGWPKAHEDEAERSVRTALDILEAIKSSKTPTGETLSVRIGIATGLVVVGDLVGEGAAQEQAVVGETPNLAARLQGLASPGQVCVSEVTRRLIGDTFDVLNAGLHELKGIEGRTPAYIVKGERAVESRFEARSGGALPEMVGRDHELALMMERWKQAISGEGQLLLLTGEAGIGKSRITRAMIDAVSQEPHVRISYQCSPYHTDSSLYPAIQQLNYAAGIQDTDSNDEKLDKLEAVLRNGDVALIAALLGIDGSQRYGPIDMSPQQQRTRTLHALADQLTAMSKEVPVLFVLEDAHWIDASTLELIDIGLDQHARERVFLLITARPNFEHGFGGHPIVTRLTLNRLGRDLVSDIVTKITGGKSLPAELLNEIADKTDGVPLFVEELTRTVLESGQLKETESAFELEGPLSHLAIPATLHDSLMARLDRMQPVKEVAQIAACIGRQFDYGLMEVISPLTGERLTEALEKLVGAELIYRRGVPPHATYTFKHALVRDAAYESLLKSRRQAIHAKLADTLEGDAKAAPELIAYHATEAGLKEKAVQFWAKAGVIAMAQPAYEEAIAHFSSALSVIDDMQVQDEWRERELELLVQLAQVYIARHGYGSEEATRAFERATELTDATGNTELLIATYYGRWIGAYIRGDIDRCLSIANSVVDNVDRLEDAVPRLIAHRLRAASLIARGRSPEALQDLDISYGLYEDNLTADFASRFAQEPGVQIQCYRLLGQWMVGQIDDARSTAEAAMESGRLLGHANTLCYAALHACILALWCRDIDALERWNAEVLVIAKEHEMSFWINLFSLFESLIEANRGNEAADIRIKSELEKYEASGNGLWVPVFLGELARHFLRFGRLAEAETCLRDALARIELMNERWVDAELNRLRGEVRVAQSDQAGAVEDFQRAIAIARDQSARPLELRAATSLARLWVQSGDPKSARELLQPLYDGFNEGGDTRDLSEAKAVLESIG